MKLIRWLIGRLILGYEKLFRPRGIQRSPEQQALIDQQTSKLKLYQLRACPFCVRVRFAMYRLSLDIETRNVRENPAYMEELVQQGGRFQTPALRIEQANGDCTWMFESRDIIDYLEQHFGHRRR